MKPIYVEQKHEIINYQNISNDFELTDYQGVCWLDLTNKTRSSYRAYRNNQYRPYLSDNQFKKLDRFQTKQKLQKPYNYYKFMNFYKNLSPEIGHFQLRYDLSAASYHDIYYISDNSVLHYCTLRNAIRRFKVPITISPVSLSLLDDFICLGGINGTLYLYDIKHNNEIFSGSFLPNQETHIVNSAKLYKDNRNYRILTASNDKKIRILDFEYILKPLNIFHLTNPINYSAFSHDFKLLASYADQKDAEILDPNSGKIVMSLDEHKDYGFCLDWHPNGIHIATGNQDTTCRIWDIRKTNRSLHVLQAEIGSVYNVKYSHDGKFLAFGEAIDYVNVYDCGKDYNVYQQIDYFGETVGIDFNPEDSKTLFIGVNIKDFDGIFEFKQKDINSKEKCRLKNSFL